jgi:hypothetical protein
MLNFIYGLILILFRHTISIAKGHIDVFPSFIGFGLIAIAFRAHKDKSKIFDGMIYPTAILMVLTAFMFITDLFGIVLPFVLVNRIIYYVVVLGTVAVVYGIVLGLRDLEAALSLHLDSDRPLAAAHYYAIIQLVILISPSDIITSISLIARLVSIVYLVYTLYKTIALYNQKKDFGQ